MQCIASIPEIVRSSSTFIKYSNNASSFRRHNRVYLRYFHFKSSKLNPNCFSVAGPIWFNRHVPSPFLEIPLCKDTWDKTMCDDTRLPPPVKRVPLPRKISKKKNSGYAHWWEVKPALSRTSPPKEPQQLEAAHSSRVLAPWVYTNEIPFSGENILPLAEYWPPIKFVKAFELMIQKDTRWAASARRN